MAEKGAPYEKITRFLSAVLALCLLTSLCLPARAAGTQDCGAKLLAITFDDGPGKYTGALLDGLAERGVHATFLSTASMLPAGRRR